MKIYMALLWIISFYCHSQSIKTIAKCELNSGNVVKLVALNTVDGDRPFLTFENRMFSAFLDTDSDYYGELVLSKCINHTMIFNLNYGSPYLKGCLVTGLKKKHQSSVLFEGLCFSERNTPESIWFGKDETLIIIRNDNNVGEWNGKYIIYDSKNKEAHTSNELPKKEGYDIYPVK